MKDDKVLTNRMEEYLKTILILENKNRVVRVKDIAESMEVKMPSVSGAMKSLREKKMINYKKNSYITLTPEGATKAESLLNKEETIRTFLATVLLIDLQPANAMAANILHCVDSVTIKRLEIITEYLKQRVIPDFKWEDTILNR